MNDITKHGTAMQSEQINDLATALATAQGAMQNAVMNRTNPHFRSKYADLSSVLDAVRAPLSAAGLSVVQTMQANGHGLMLRTTLMHSSGQFISTEYPLPATQKPHEMGSALTYARRYSLSALICNSSDEDDDGNSAMTKTNVEPAPEAKPVTLIERNAFMVECRDAIASFDDHEALGTWFNSDAQKKARKDYQLDDSQVATLKTAALDRINSLKGKKPDPISSGVAA